MSDFNLTTTRINNSGGVNYLFYLFYNSKVSAFDMSEDFIKQS
jgi:hypothetical protein